MGTSAVRADKRWREVKAAKDAKRGQKMSEIVFTTKKTSVGEGAGCVMRR